MTTQTEKAETKRKTAGAPVDHAAPGAAAAAADPFDVAGFDASARKRMTNLNISIDGFWSPELDVPVHGQSGVFRKRLVPYQGVPMAIKTRPKRDGDDRKDPQEYVIVRLTAATLARNENKEVVVLQPGQYLWVDIKYETRAMERYLPRRDPDGRDCIFHICYVPEERRALKGGHSVWKGHFEGERLAESDIVALRLKGAGSMLSPGGAFTSGGNEKLLQASAEVIAESGEDIPF